MYGCIIRKRYFLDNMTWIDGLVRGINGPYH